MSVQANFRTNSSKNFAAPSQACEIPYKIFTRICIRKLLSIPYFHIDLNYYY